MAENVDITECFENLQFVIKLNITYRFGRLEYLVADKYWNFFVLPHFNSKRTTKFKLLDKSKGYIHYNGIKYYTSRLRNLAQKTEEKYTFHGNQEIVNSYQQINKSKMQ